MNRFYAVCRPYKAPHLCRMKNVYTSVILVALFSFIFNVPRFFELRVYQTDEGVFQWARSDFSTDKLYKTIYVDVLYYVFTFVVPLLILAYVNTMVTVAYQEMRRRKRRMTSRSRGSDNDGDVTLVMILVVLIFMLCQAPARIVQLVWKYKYAHCRQYAYYIIHLSHTLEVLNSSVNFIIYVCFRKHFRTIVKSSFCMTSTNRWMTDVTQRFTTTEGLSMGTVEYSRQNGSSIKRKVPKNVTNEDATDVVMNPMNNIEMEEINEHFPSESDKLCSITDMKQGLVDSL